MEETLETVGMAHFTDRAFCTLSGGEQQRVILARALDRTVISAIHVLNIAAMYCDRLYAVKDGAIVGQGTPEELLTEAFVRLVYEADAKVLLGEDGQLHILYHPRHRSVHP